MDEFSFKESMASISAYVLFIIISVYLGFGIFVKAKNTRFYQSSIFEWQQLMLDFQHRGIAWPDLDKNKPVAYMKDLTEVIGKYDFSKRTPKYLQKVRSKDGRVKNVFILAQKDTLQIYGLDKSMALNLDKMIDKRRDLAAGDWLAYPSETSSSYNAIWYYKKS